MYQKVTMAEVNEILKQWESGAAYQGSLARRTVTRYVKLAREYGLRQGGGKSQITQGMRNYVSGKVQVGRHKVRTGTMWGHCETHKEFLKECLGKGLQITNIVRLMQRHTGILVPYCTLMCFLQKELGYSKTTGESTVRIADSAPGKYFVWLTYGQRVRDVINGMEHCLFWRYFQGITA